jgi:hypothetical protein
MSCERVNPTFSASDTGRNRGCILDTLRKIDQLQREHLRENDCVGCGGPLIAKVFDTKPIVFTLCNDEKFTAFFGLSAERTDLFRVEEVMRDCVLLRLLKRDGGCVRCTKFTAILNLDCICAIQCFEPINCRIDRKEQCDFED